MSQPRLLNLAIAEFRSRGFGAIEELRGGKSRAYGAQLVQHHFPATVATGDLSD